MLCPFSHLSAMGFGGARGVAPCDLWGLGGHLGSPPVTYGAWGFPLLQVMGFSSPAQGFTARCWVKVAGHDPAWPWGEEKG